MNDREAEFLRARQERQQQQQEKQPSKEDTSEVWSQLEKSLKEWDIRLEETIPKDSTQFKTANQRQSILTQLEELENSLNSNGSSSNNNTVPSSLSLLPLSDLRRWHQQCSVRMERLQQQRDRVCPPTRFVFRRYRAAQRSSRTAAQKNGYSNHDKDAAGAAGAGTSKEEAVTMTTLGVSVDLGRSIQNLNHAIVTELSDGVIRIQQKDAQPELLTLPPQQQSLLLQNLQHCHIQITANCYKALHILRVHHSTIHLDTFINGAIHMTGCSHLSLVTSAAAAAAGAHNTGCHQLRVHDTRESRIDAGHRIGAPPILEGCRKMVLLARDDNEGVLRQTKDFDWLRKDEASPNYRIERIKEGGTEEEQKQNGGKAGGQNGNHNNVSGMQRTGGPGNRNNETATDPSIITAPMEVAAVQNDDDDDDDEDDDEDEL